MNLGQVNLIQAYSVEDAVVVDLLFLEVVQLYGGLGVARPVSDSGVWQDKLFFIVPIARLRQDYSLTRA